MMRCGRTTTIPRAALLASRRCFSFTPLSLAQKFLYKLPPAVPLDEAYPDPPSEQEIWSQVPAHGPPRITTLPSGLRVVTAEGPSNAGFALSSVGIFVESGSRWETAETAGLNNFLESAILKSTKNQSEFALIRELQSLAANVTASASRELFILSSDVPRHGGRPQAVVKALANVITNHASYGDELRIVTKDIYSSVKARQTQGDIVVMEGMHAAAYSGATLGRPLYLAEHNLDQVAEAETFRGFLDTFFTPKRLVLGGVNVDHDEFVELAKTAFAGLKPDSIDAKALPAAKYTGGDTRVHLPSTGEEIAHFGIAFETADWHSADLVPMCVLQMMMGGGGAFSAGGPGKGMCSRLYESVLNKYGWVESANSFNAIYNDSALFGIYGTSHAENVGSLAEVFAKELTGMAEPVKDVELKRAKNQLKSNVLMQLESRPLVLEDISRQVITYGKIKSALETAALIDSVTSADIQRVARKMLSTRPSVCAYGNLSALPLYHELAKNFG